MYTVFILLLIDKQPHVSSYGGGAIRGHSRVNRAK
jgi:hypothetical protein